MTPARRRGPRAVSTTMRGAWLALLAIGLTATLGHGAFEIRSGPFATSPLLVSFGQESGPSSYAPAGAWSHRQSAAGHAWLEMRALAPYRLPGVLWSGLAAEQSWGASYLRVDASGLSSPGYGEWHGSISSTLMGALEVAADAFFISADPLDSDPGANASAATASVGYRVSTAPLRARIWIRDAVRAGAYERMGLQPTAGLELEPRLGRGWRVSWRRSWERRHGDVLVEDRLTVRWHPVPWFGLAHGFGGHTRSKLTEVDLTAGRWKAGIWMVESEVGLPPSSGFSIRFDISARASRGTRPARATPRFPEPPPEAAPDSLSDDSSRRAISPAEPRALDLPAFDQFDLPEAFTEGDTLWAWEDSLASIQPAWPRAKEEATRVRRDAGSGVHGARGVRVTHVSGQGRRRTVVVPWRLLSWPDSTTAPSLSTLQALAGQTREFRDLPEAAALPDSLQSGYLAVLPYLDDAPVNAPREPYLQGEGPGSAETRIPSHEVSTDRARVRSYVESRLAVSSSGRRTRRSAVDLDLPTSLARLRARGLARQAEATRVRDLTLIHHAIAPRWGLSWSDGRTGFRWGSGLVPGLAPAPISTSSGAGSLPTPGTRRSGDQPAGAGSLWAWMKPSETKVLAVGRRDGRGVALAGMAIGSWGMGAAVSSRARQQPSQTLWIQRRSKTQAQRLEVARDPRVGWVYGGAWHVRTRIATWRWGLGVDLLESGAVPPNGPRELEASSGDRSLFLTATGRLVHARSVRARLQRGSTHLVLSWNHDRKRAGRHQATASRESRQIRARLSSRHAGVKSELRFAHLDRRSRTATPAPSLSADEAGTRTVDVRARLRLLWPSNARGRVRGGELGWAERARHRSSAGLARGGWFGGWIGGDYRAIEAWTAGLIHATSLPPGTRITPSWVSGVSVARTERVPVFAGSLRLRPLLGLRLMVRASIPLPGRVNRAAWVASIDGGVP